MPDNPALPLATAEDAARMETPRVLCRLCGRPLTGRQARRWGLGDGCRAKLRERAAPRPGAFEVEQEVLPGEFEVEQGTLPGV